MRTTTVIIGGGHAGLAMSRRLAERSIDHVVLERGEVANSWRRERWDSLRLLTPNWQTRLPGYRYDGTDPHGFRTMPETIALIERYAQRINAPVHTHTEVVSVNRSSDGFRVQTTQGEWRCRSVVVASGACNIAKVPAAAAEVPPTVGTLTAMQYRNPTQVRPGGVLVVGASASGAQIADELQRSGRQVTLAVGEHVRVPRTYRGRDIKWWMDAAGVLNEHYKSFNDLPRARNLPSLQLGGSLDKRDFDLNALTSRGVKLVGRLAGIRDAKALFSGSLPNHCAMADLKLNRLLDVLDVWATDSGLHEGIDAPHRFEPTEIPDSTALGIDLGSGEIRTIIWATGYRPEYSWLKVPVFDRKGRINHDGGVVDVPGLYVLGLPFLRRRKSSLIDGAADDSKALASHLESTLDSSARTRLYRRPALANPFAGRPAVFA